MLCEKCGTEIQEGALFCETCGTPVVKEADAAATDAGSADAWATTTPAPPAPPADGEALPGDEVPVFPDASATQVFDQGAPGAEQSAPGAPFDQPATATTPFSQAQPAFGTQAQPAFGQAQPDYDQRAMPQFDQQAAPVYGQPVPPGTQSTSDGGTAPLVLGILSIVAATVLGWTFVGPIAGIVMGIIGIVMGGKVLKADPANGKARGGRITGVIGLILSIIALVATIALTVILGMAVTQAVSNPDALVEEMEKIAAMDETGEAQKEIDELKQELENAGISIDTGTDAQDASSASSAPAEEPVDYTNGQAFDSWAAECTATGNQPTLYAITELKGWQFETMLQQLGYVWDPSVNTWFRDDGSYYGMVDNAANPIDDEIIATGDKGGTGLGAAHILVVGGFTSAREALSQMGQVVTDDVMFSDDDQTALAVVHGPSMTEYLVMVDQSPDDGKGYYVFFVFPEEACANGLFNAYFGGETGSSIDEIWKAVTGGAVGDYISNR